MDKVGDLIAQFRSEDTDRLANIDTSAKPSIIATLEDHTDDPRVGAFFLSVASDENEYDLARIEVFKIFEVHDHFDETLRQRIGRVIKDVLINSHDNGVRNYAAMAAASYLETEGLWQRIAELVRDNNADSDLRWNAFAAIESSGPSPRNIDVLRSLQRDGEFNQSSTRLLAEWRV
jgi:hypothetical protein